RRRKEVTQMARARNWRDVRADALAAGRITDAGVAAARRQHDEQARAYRLKQVRAAGPPRGRGRDDEMSQSRVSRIEAGDISHAEWTLRAYVQALGGVLRVTADFGGETLTIA